MTRLLATCCLLLATVLASAAERIPADCRWVVAFDVQAVAASQVGGWIKAQLGRQPVSSQLKVLDSLTGLNPLRDLRRITICGAAGGEETGLVLVRGTFNAEKIESVAELAQDHATVSAGSRTIHTWTDKGKTAAGCLAAPDLLILGRSAERIRQGLESLDLPGGLAIAFPAGWEGAAMAVAATDGLDTLADQGPQSAMLKNFRSLAAKVSETGDQLVLDAIATAAGDAQAQQLLDAGNGLRALIQLQKPENVDQALLAAVAQAQFTRSGSQLTLHMTLPIADAKRLVEKQQQKKNGD